jgi:UDPglucose 6-dehydrogenase
MSKPEIAITGYGWVGKSMHDLFPEAYIHDEPILEVAAASHMRENTIKAGRAVVNACKINFISVPTPNRHDGSLDSSIVEEVVGWCDSEVIVIRSTLNPGDADRIKAETGKRIVTQPEYLGETVAHPLLDQSDRPFMILGGDPPDRRAVIEAYQGAYNANISIRQVTNKEAEVIKLSENRAILHKVAECQELYDACEVAGVDFYTVRDAVYGDDPRFNLWFSFVYPESRGANSKCIPKDPMAWAAWAESFGYHPAVTNAILEKNKEWNALNNHPQQAA